jgi:hypothetical protein
VRGLEREFQRDLAFETLAVGYDFVHTAILISDLREVDLFIGRNRADTKIDEIT